ncbi:MAG TPA: alpha/beta hydrolase [Solirubrobacteraceae bacterium]|nr:alpha/beta hydrolase [Solirubrobacteraceae bacterium]
MAKVVGVHGIAQQHRGGPQLTKQWLLDVQGGLEVAGFRSTADALGASDLRVAFYGDLFREPGTMDTDPPAYAADDLDEDDVELLEALYDQAVGQQPELGATRDAMAGIRPTVREMLDRVLRSRSLGGIAEHLLIGDFKQVRAYLRDPARREQVLARLARELTADTRIVIGHSLGSVIAYELCCQPQAGNIELLVTLGSPLGAKPIFEHLTPRPDDGVGAWPQRLARWVNVADPRDIVALRPQLAPLFAAGPNDARVVDRSVDNGDHPHDITPYLNSGQTGEALGTAI